MKMEHKPVIFNYPYKVKDINEMIKLDMHSHTTYSDGHHNVEMAIKVAKEKKIGLCITDHNRIQGSLNICKGKGVFSIPGIEVTGRDFIDLLIYFYSTRDMKAFYYTYVRGHEVPDHGFQFHRLTWYTSEIINIAKKFNAFIVVPHPDARKPKNSYKFFRKREEMLSNVDAIEGINSLIKRKSNLLAIGWAETLGKPITGSSDAHFYQQIGNAVTCTNESTIEGFLEAIRKKHNVVVGMEVSLWNKLYSNYKIFRANWANWVDV